jgi:HprK-related kinase A
MRLGAAPESALRAQFRAAGVRLRLAGLCFNLRTDVPAAIEQILQMYCDHPLETDAGIDDFRIYLSYTDPLRRFIKRRIQVFIEGEAVFLPTPHRLAYISIESALNWCISTTASNVILHAAVVERDGLAAILPAPSGSGKSTLCAALVTRGWRLLSDELAVLRPSDRRLQPLARPISLKNEAITLIRRWAPDAHFSPVFARTIDGDIAYLRPPADSVARVTEIAEPALIVLPTYQAGAAVKLQPLGKSETFRLLVSNSINYHITQRYGFDTVAGLVDSCAAYRLSYGTLTRAVDTMETLLTQVQATLASGHPAMTTT